MLDEVVQIGEEPHGLHRHLDAVGLDGEGIRRGEELARPDVEVLVECEREREA